MQRLLLTIALALPAAGPAAAQATVPETETETETCAELGLPNAWLTAMFCDQIAEITGGGTRSLGDDDPAALGGNAPPDWMEIDALAEAYRVDPQRTLELIARIRNAGGLPPPG